ncbi:PP2C family protein-serine/threonine phosphatase [Microbacterium sp. B2969]|uniref:PP2C family protein-serine/threonine phosphatase n=1 Tax=Microbacterium alkaliflavum TaxID=3248839 RepID=A0ABW7QBU4_9MICO
MRAAAVTDVGPHRAVNQDAAFTASWGAAVADGVGGGPAGEVASAALLRRLVAEADGALDLDELAISLRIANWELRARAERDPALEGMATTFTGLLVTPAGGLVLAHTGDSRAYLLRRSAMSRETRDDSFVQLLVDSGVVRAADAASHPHRNVITASLHGADDDLVVLAEREARPGDRWLLCSDGVTDYLPDHAIATLLDDGDPLTAAQAIVDYALSAGSRDNVTAVVCDVVTDAVRHSSAHFHGAAAEVDLTPLDEDDLDDDLESA